ncbi:hypothetical protein PR202_gb00618 [Eleusine coracana subsp. coracana]|uniref:Uncharacterized protein n=1 Tax=Eleusine coracana subsp. coracana TaxID=191504 RepID=A0AAV5DTW2_ELECO|nr:hypothetical protein PR202_gb00618 [Eleusine coracana subsp. coracana]
MTTVQTAAKRSPTPSLVNYLLCQIHPTAPSRWGTEKHAGDELIKELDEAGSTIRGEDILHFDPGEESPTRLSCSVMGSEEAPLLLPAPAVEGCPGCAMELRKARSNGRIPYKEFFFVGITTLASSLPITCLFPFMYFMVNTAWGLGVIVGPALGGYLAQPADKYPHMFSKSSIFGRFPYLLPCLSVSSFAVIVLIGCTWLPILSLWAVSDRNYGGLSFSTEDVGEVLAMAGASLLVYQLIIYRWVHKVLGTVNSSRIASAVSMLVLATYPFMTHLHGVKLYFALYSAAVMKSALACQEQRGTANGISTTAMSFFKATAPIGAGALFSWAQRRQDAAFLPGDQVVFAVLILLELFGLISTFEPFLVLPTFPK